jgi:MFS family permease
MNSKLLKPTILSISLLTIMASAAISPALKMIGDAFPHVDSTVIRYILVLPNLLVIPVSLFTGWLVTRINKKLVLEIGLITYLIGGVGGGFSQNIVLLLVMRGVLGIGLGMIMPLSVSLITDFFEGQERAKMLGLSSAVNQLGGILLLSVAGWLAAINWQTTFWVYTLAACTILLTLIWLPSPPEARIKEKVKVKLPGEVFLLALIGTFMMIAFYVVNTDLSFFIQGERVFSVDKPLFASKEELTEHLKTGEISDLMREAFKQNGIELSENAIFSQISSEGDKEKSWQVSDGNNNYIVIRDMVNNELVINKGLGTSVVAGFALSFLALCGVAGGLMLNRMVKAIGAWCIPGGMVLMAIGYAILANAFNLLMVFLAMPFIGFSAAIMTPPLMLRIGKVVPPMGRALAISIVSSCILFGAFLSPVIMKAISFIGNNDTSSFRFICLAAILGVAGITGLILSGRGRMEWLKKEPPGQG